MKSIRDGARSVSGMVLIENAAQNNRRIERARANSAARHPRVIAIKFAGFDLEIVRHANQRAAAAGSGIVVEIAKRDRRMRRRAETRRTIVGAKVEFFENPGGIMNI